MIEYLQQGQDEEFWEENLVAILRIVASPFKIYNQSKKPETESYKCLGNANQPNLNKYNGYDV